MQKILTIRYGTIGDSIFASAFYRELRKNLPASTIDILVDDIAANVMQNCPYINNIHYIKGKYKSLFYYIKLFRQYDTVYFLKNDNFFTKVAFWARVKNRIGFDIRRNKFLTHKSPYNEDRNEIDCYLDLLKLTGIGVENDTTELWIKDSDENKIKELYGNTNKLKILIQAYSRFPQKNWIDEYWVELITYLSDKQHAQVYFAGGKKDIEGYELLLTQLEELKIKPINTSGHLSVTETMALAKNCDLIIGVDSGIIHIAAALKKTSILLHGPTSLIRWQPRNDKCIILSKHFECSPCLLQTNGNNKCKNKIALCMLELQPSFVIEKLEEIIGGTINKNE